MSGLGMAGVLAFQRDATVNLPAAGLVLWPNDDGYDVPNITPAELQQLTVSQYNAILMEFAEMVAQPAARRCGFQVTSTSSRQSLEDWLTTEAAEALRRFSAAANKSSSASHPMDERRWFDFIIAVHHTGGTIGSDRLFRWLHEAEGWGEEEAHQLAGEFERSLALLARNAETL